MRTHPQPGRWRCLGLSAPTLTITLLRLGLGRHRAPPISTTPRSLVRGLQLSKVHALGWWGSVVAIRLNPRNRMRRLKSSPTMAPAASSVNSGPSLGSPHIFPGLFDRFFRYPAFQRWSQHRVPWQLHCIGGPGAGKVRLDGPEIGP
jgi:hypothetical protein